MNENFGILHIENNIAKISRIFLRRKWKGGSCTNKVISRYERGTVEMGVQTLCDVAESLKVPVNELMPERLRVNTGEDEGLDELVAIFAGLTAERRLQLLQMARFLMAQETGKIM